MADPRTNRALQVSVIGARGCRMTRMLFPPPPITTLHYVHKHRFCVYMYIRAYL